MKCANHPDKDAVAICVSCGTGLCTDCRASGRMTKFCDECARSAEPMRVYPAGEKHGHNAWAVVAWVLAVVGCWPGLDFVSVAGVILGFVALGDMRLKDKVREQFGRGYAIGAIAIGVARLVVTLVFLAYLLEKGLSLSPWLNPFKYVG